jgi:hypothetical protein
MVYSTHIRYIIKYFIKFCNYFNHFFFKLHFVVIDTCINFPQIYIFNHQHKMLFLLTLALLAIELSYFEHNL